MKTQLIGAIAAATLALGAMVAPATAEENFIVVQSTTSTQNSGLLDAILPAFTEKSGIEVRVVAVGTGQAIKNAENGDGDVMYNDFVVVGPAADPAGVAGMKDAEAALGKIAAAKAPFASRGDDSGTHKAELRLWKDAGIDLAAASGGWYRETGSGMGATLNTGIGMGAYVLTDRATWISFGNKGDHTVVVEGDPELFNQYGVILVNPDRHPAVKAEAGQAFIDWLTGDEGQAAIANYRVDGQQLFFPNADMTGDRS